MKRYLLFAGNWYYPAGGAFPLDFRGDFDSYTDAELEAERQCAESCTWAHIYDTRLSKVVVEFSRNHEGTLDTELK